MAWRDGRHVELTARCDWRTPTSGTLERVTDLSTSSVSTSAEPTNRPNVGGIDIDLAVFATNECIEAAQRFDDCGYIPLPGLLTTAGLSQLRAEVDALFPLTQRRDFVMECMGGTPRNMTTLGGELITERAPGISAVYQSSELMGALGVLLKKKIVVADDPVERHVLNILHKAGDTHGYHVDDYPIALVMFVESPTCPEGCGRLEFCPATGDGSADANLESHPSFTRSHQAGDAYILRSDRLNHRVQPIHDGCLRTVLNFAYGFDGEQVARTPSASILYS